MPRPAGRSGWVSTRTMSCPAAARASSAAAANGGVPAKMTRTAGRSERGAHGRGVGPVFARLLEELGLDAVALERGEVVDEDLALQMIEFVLDAHRQEAVGGELERLAVAI